MSDLSMQKWQHGDTASARSGIFFALLAMLLCRYKGKQMDFQKKTIIDLII